MTTNATRAISTLSITAELANQIIADCSRKAEEMGKPMVIAICDPSGILKAFTRMDGAPLLAVSIAQDKAYTAAAYGVSTDMWHEYIKNDPPLALGIVHVPRLTIFGGGYPIREGNDVIGSIGISGGHYTEDMECARYGLEKNGFAVS